MAHVMTEPGRGFRSVAVPLERTSVAVAGRQPVSELFSGWGGVAMSSANALQEEPCRSSKRIRVLVVGENTRFTDELASTPWAYLHLDVVALADDDQDALRLGRHVRPDVFVVDARTVPEVAASTARTLHECQPTVPVVVLVGESDGCGLTDLLGGDTVSCLSDAASARDWVVGIRAACESHPSAVSSNGYGLRTYPDRALTDKELAVLGWMKAGLDDFQIAEQLAVNELTARLCVNHLVSKVGAANRREAVVRARGWLEAEFEPQSLLEGEDAQR
jgi:DNA-binding NarL/FixJ family response regulator